MKCPRTKCKGKLTTASLDVYWCDKCKDGKGQTWLIHKLNRYKSFEDAAAKRMTL